MGSAVPAFLLGVAFTNLIRGVPIDANMIYVGGFWNLLNPFALFGGLVTFSGFTLHGAVFLSLKTEDEVMESAQAAARKLWLPTLIVLVVFVVAMYFFTDVLKQLGHQSRTDPHRGESWRSSARVTSFTRAALAGPFS